MRFAEADMYREWLAKGFSGDMAYLARAAEQREDCRRIFPAARAVIVCGLSYHSPFPMSHEISDSRHGWISRYGWGDDYHVVVKQKLYQLMESLRTESSAPLDAKVCVDTIPLLERLHGYYAGLGWIGKNGTLIHPQYGSWFFLGEILVNLELEPDVPAADCCGTCTRCLDACPTGALVAPRLLDARKCLSYLTIEYRGAIPDMYRPLFGNTVFGCDRCQDACPWNQQAAAPACAEFLPRAGLYRPDLAWLCTLSPEAFNAAFRRSSIQRTKRRGLLRNTIIAMGNSGNADFIPLLQNMYAASEPLIQAHIDWALARL